MKTFYRHSIDAVKCAMASLLETVAGQTTGLLGVYNTVVVWLQE